MASLTVTTTISPSDPYRRLDPPSTWKHIATSAQANAGSLAQRLASHPAVALVRYPGLADDPGHALAARQMRGFGATLSFEVHGGALAAERVCEAVRLITYATSLGGVESLLERRARWPGDADMPPGLIRFSVGIEHVEDLWADLERALGAAVD